MSKIRLIGYSTVAAMRMVLCMLLALTAPVSWSAPPANSSKCESGLTGGRALLSLEQKQQAHPILQQPWIDSVVATNLQRAYRYATRHLLEIEADYALEAQVTAMQVMLSSNPRAFRQLTMSKLLDKISGEAWRSNLESDLAWLKEQQAEFNRLTAGGQITAPRMQAELLYYERQLKRPLAAYDALDLGWMTSALATYFNRVFAARSEGLDAQELRRVVEGAENNLKEQSGRLTEHKFVREWRTPLWRVMVFLAPAFRSLDHREFVMAKAIGLSYMGSSRVPVSYAGSYGLPPQVFSNHDFAHYFDDVGNATSNADLLDQSHMATVRDWRSWSRRLFTQARFADYVLGRIAKLSAQTGEQRALRAYVVGSAFHLSHEHNVWPQAQIWATELKLDDNGIWSRSFENEMRGEFETGDDLGVAKKAAAQPDWHRRKVKQSSALLQRWVRQYSAR